jgi:hypothetical protein
MKIAQIMMVQINPGTAHKRRIATVATPRIQQHPALESSVAVFAARSLPHPWMTPACSIATAADVDDL